MKSLKRLQKNQQVNNLISLLKSSYKLNKGCRTNIFWYYRDRLERYYENKKKTIIGLKSRTINKVGFNF